MWPRPLRGMVWRRFPTHVYPLRVVKDVIVGRVFMYLVERGVEGVVRRGRIGKRGCPVRRYQHRRHTLFPPPSVTTPLPTLFLHHIKMDFI